MATKPRSFKEEHPLGGSTRWEGGRGVQHATRARPPFDTAVNGPLTRATLPLHAEKRQAEAARIKEKYPDRIPVSRANPNVACVRCKAEELA